MDVSWTIKKAEHWRIDAFKLWCWRRLLRVPWAARRSNQSILKEISHEYSLEGMMLKLKLQYFGHLMGRTNSLEKTLMLGKIEGRKKWRQNRGWDGWMASPTQSTWVWINSGSWWWTGGLACCSPWGCKESDKTEWLNNNNKYNQGFSDDSDGNKSACNARDPGLIPGLRRSSGEEMATHSSVFA